MSDDARHRIIQFLKLTQLLLPERHPWLETLPFGIEIYQLLGGIRLFLQPRHQVNVIINVGLQVALEFAERVVARLNDGPASLITVVSVLFVGHLVTKHNAPACQQ